MGIEYNGYPVLDPVALREDLLRCDPPIPVDSWWGRVNTYRSSLGFQTGRAFLLCIESDLVKMQESKQIDKPHDLIFYDPSDTTKKFKIRKAYVKTWRRIYPAAEGDTNTAVLLELVDIRDLLARSPVNRRYNLRGCPGGDFLANTIDGCVPWTWARLVEDLWKQLPGLGDFPGLPFTPHGTPEGFVFDDGSLLDAINHVLTRLCCAALYDPTDATWEICQLGDKDAMDRAKDVLDAWVNRESLVWDDFPDRSAVCQYPETIRVCTWKQPSPDDGTSRVHATDVQNLVPPGQGRVEPGTVVTLWDDLPAVYAGLTVTNSTALSERAAERARDYYRFQQFVSQERVRSFKGVDRLAAQALLGGTGVILAVHDRGSGLQTEIASDDLVPGQDLEAWRPHRLWYPSESECIPRVSGLSGSCFSGSGRSGSGSGGSGDSGGSGGSGSGGSGFSGSIPSGGSIGSGSIPSGSFASGCVPVNWCADQLGTSASITITRNSSVIFGTAYWNGVDAWVYSSAGLTVRLVPISISSTLLVQVTTSGGTDSTTVGPSCTTFTTDSFTVAGETFVVAGNFTVCNPSGSRPSGSVSGSFPSGSVPSGSRPSGSISGGSIPSGSRPSGSFPSGGSQFSGFSGGSGFDLLCECLKRLCVVRSPGGSGGSGGSGSRGPIIDIFFDDGTGCLIRVPDCGSSRCGSAPQCTCAPKTTVYARFPGSGVCAGVAGVTVPMTYDAGTQRWTGTVAGNNAGCPVTVRMQCLADGTINSTCDIGDTTLCEPGEGFTNTLVSCSPFRLDVVSTCDFQGDGGTCCVGPVTYSITAT